MYNARGRRAKVGAVFGGTGKPTAELTIGKSLDAHAKIPLRLKQLDDISGVALFRFIKKHYLTITHSYD